MRGLHRGGWELTTPVKTSGQWVVGKLRGEIYEQHPVLESLLWMEEGEQLLYKSGRQLRKRCRPLQGLRLEDAALYSLPATWLRRLIGSALSHTGVGADLGGAVSLRGKQSRARQRPWYCGSEPL